MMTGTIDNFRPHLRLYVKGAGGYGIFEFTIDTGYEGTLTLSESDCLALQLPFIKERDFQLANGAPIKCNTYRLAVEWDSRIIDVEILALGEEALLGAQMLEGYKLCLDFGNNTLTIEESTKEDAQP